MKYQPSGISITTFKSGAAFQIKPGGILGSLGRYCASGSLVGKGVRVRVGVLVDIVVGVRDGTGVWLGTDVLVSIIVGVRDGTGVWLGTDVLVGIIVRVRDGAGV